MQLRILSKEINKKIPAVLKRSCWTQLYVHFQTQNKNISPLFSLLCRAECPFSPRLWAFHWCSCWQIPVFLKRWHNLAVTYIISQLHLCHTLRNRFPAFIIPACIRWKNSCSGDSTRIYNRNNLAGLRRGSSCTMCWCITMLFGWNMTLLMYCTCLNFFPDLRKTSGHFVESNGDPNNEEWKPYGSGIMFFMFIFSYKCNLIKGYFNYLLDNLKQD